MTTVASAALGARGRRLSRLRTWPPAIGVKSNANWPCGQNFSAQARMPPTAQRAPRGEERGLLVFDCGAGAHFLRALPHRPGGRVPIRLTARGSSPSSFGAHPIQRDGRLEDDDADGTRLGSAQARRGDWRSLIAAALAGNRCPTTPEQPASGRPPDQSGPGRSERPPLRVPGAIARLGRPAVAVFQMLAGETRLRSAASEADPIGDPWSVCGSLLEPVGDLVKSSGIA